MKVPNFHSGNLGYVNFQTSQGNPPVFRKYFVKIEKILASVVHLRKVVKQQQ